VVEAGWSGIKNGKLLALAATEFDAFITVDKNLPFQQNMAKLPIALIVIDAVSNELPVLPPLIPALLRELASLNLGWHLQRKWTPAKRPVFRGLRAAAKKGMIPHEN
jgi:hypothetical protein